jgi:hypothetical protein
LLGHGLDFSLYSFSFMLAFWYCSFLDIHSTLAFWHLGPVIVFFFFYDSNDWLTSDEVMSFSLLRYTPHWFSDLHVFV